MSVSVTGGATDVTRYFVLRLTATGVEAPGLTITDLDFQYTRCGVAPAAKVDATALAATDSAHADNKAIEVNSTSSKGLYRTDWPDAAFAAGVPFVILTVTAPSCFTESMCVPIDPPVNATKLNGTALTGRDIGASVLLSSGTGAGQLSLSSGLVTLAGVAHTGAVIPTVSTLTGHTPQTGDSYARLGAPAGASIAADIAAIEAQTDDIGTAGAGLTAVPWNAAWDAEVQSEVADALAVYDPPTKAELDSAVAPLALEATLGTPAGASLAADIAVIESQTDDIGVAGAGLSAIPWNAAWDAEVQSEVADALAAYDPPTKAELDSAVAPLALEATAQSILTDTAEIGAAGAGLTVLATAANLATVAGYLDTEIAAILADTNELQADWANGGRLDLLIDAIKARTDVVAVPTRTGTAQAGAAGTITLDASASAVDDFYNNQIIIITGGTGAGQARIVSDYVGSTKVASVNGNWATTPDNTSTFALLGFGAIPGATAPTAAEVRIEMDANSTKLASIETDTQDLQSRVPAALVSGRMDASVGAMAADTLTAAALAADAVTEIQSGLSTLNAAGVRTAVGLSSANLDTQLDALPTNAELASAVSPLATSAALATVAGYLDTEVAAILEDTGTTLNDLIVAIKAKTDGLPSDPADASVVAGLIAAVQAVVDAVKLKTDNLPSDPADESLIQAAIATLQGFVDTEVAAIKAKTDNLPASPANEATLTTIAGYLDTEIAAIKAKTDNLPASPAAVGSAMTLTSGERDSIAAAHLDLANGVETGVTLRQAQRIQLSSAAGKLSGAATATVTIRDANDSKNRIVATVDADGNRTAVTLDAS